MKAVLVFAPGAGGQTAKAMKVLQDTRLRAAGIACCRCDDAVVGPDEKRWNTFQPGSKANLAHVAAVAARAAAAHPGLPIFLGGASFGNRVLAELLAAPPAELPSAVRRDALLSCGYPLHKTGKPEGADPKRADHLLRLPASVRTLFVQGSEDEFNGPRRMAALRDVTSQMKGDAEIVEVPGGGHTVPGATGLKQRGLKQADVDALVVDAIVRFVSA